MTSIVGIAYKGKVFIGGDSCGSNSYTKTIVGNKKVFIVGDFIIGCTSSFRMIDLLKHVLSIEKPRIQEKVDKYIRTEFINKVISTFKDNSFATKKDEQWKGGNFLVGYHGKLYEVQDDFSVLDCPLWGSAVGIGEVAARGSLWTTRKKRTEPVVRIRCALQASENVVVGVQRPFHILSK